MRCECASGAIFLQVECSSLFQASGDEKLGGEEERLCVCVVCVCECERDIGGCERNVEGERGLKSRDRERVKVGDEGWGRENGKR